MDQKNNCGKSGVSYKYLKPAQQTFTTGMQGAVKAIKRMSGGANSDIQKKLDEYFTEKALIAGDARGQEIKDAYELIGADACRETVELVLTELRKSIEKAVTKCFEERQDIEEHRREIDAEYAKMKLTVGMALVDDFGYPYGNIKSIGTDGDGKTVCTIERIYIFDGEKPEVTMTEEEVKAYTVI